MKLFFNLGNGELGTKALPRFLTKSIKIPIFFVSNGGELKYKRILNKYGFQAPYKKGFKSAKLVWDLRGWESLRV